jgi:glutamate synthase (NADPH/NADH) small chain
VLLAIGFDGTEQQPLLEQFGVTRNGRGAVDAGDDWQTGVPGVFVAGDMHRGASLIVWAIAEGREVARAVDASLRESPSVVPTRGQDRAFDRR